jgi:hypothetical protein
VLSAPEGSQGRASMRVASRHAFIAVRFRMSARSASGPPYADTSVPPRQVHESRSRAPMLILIAILVGDTNAPSYLFELCIWQQVLSARVHSSEADGGARSAHRIRRRGRLPPRGGRGDIGVRANCLAHLVIARDRRAALHIPSARQTPLRHASHRRTSSMTMVSLPATEVDWAKMLTDGAASRASRVGYTKIVLTLVVL